MLNPGTIVKYTGKDNTPLLLVTLETVETYICLGLSKGFYNYNGKQQNVITQTQIV